MVQIENLTADAVEICIINVCEGSGDNSHNPGETHWRVGLLNSGYGRHKLHEVLENYPDTLQTVMATWGDAPVADES